MLITVGLTWPLIEILSSVFTELEHYDQDLHHFGYNLLYELNDRFDKKNCL